MSEQVECRFYGPATIVRADQDKRKVRMSVSSEKPVKRWDSWEILSHQPTHVDLSFLASGNAPLLADHDRYGGQVGVVEKAWISKGRLLADVRFSRSDKGQQELADVLDGIRTNVSIGYAIDHSGDKQAGEKAGRPVVVRQYWKPLEVSLVSIPADDSVGTNRSGGKEMAKKVESKASEREQYIAEVMAGGVSREDAERRIDNLLTRGSAPINENRDTMADCLALQRAHNIPPKILEEVAAAGGGLQEYRERAWEIALKNLNQSQTVIHSPGSNLSPAGRAFSISRLLRAMMDPANPRAQREAALEMDVCAEAAERQQGNREIRGTLVPVEALLTRTLTAGTATAGAELVGTVVDGSRFAEFLRARSIGMLMGATVMDWSGSNLSIPRLDAGSTAGWVLEGSPGAPSDPVTGALALVPKTLIATTSYTKKLLVSSSPQVDQIVNQDLAGAIAAAVDAAIIQGSGTAGQPTGLLNDALLPTPITFAGANPTFAEIVQMETTVDTADNLVGSALGYVAHPGLAGGMKTTDKGTDTGSFLWEGYPGRPGFGMVNGYPALSSSSCGSGNMVFGNWAEMYICFWLNLDLTIDPYTQAKSGIVEVTAQVEVDLGARRPKSFIVGQSGP